MSDCPRCGHPLDPDAASCFACAQGMPPRDYLVRLPSGRIVSPADAFRRNPTYGWTLRGAIVGAVLGVATLAVVALVGIAQGWVKAPIESVLETCLGGAIAGGILGAAATVVWKSLLRPIWLALFWTKDFEREYGTPEEQGIVRKTGE